MIPQPEVQQSRWLKRQYPDYIDDPDGLERFREAVLRTPGHDMACVNHNSLGRLLDTIQRLKNERAAAFEAGRAEGVQEAAEVGEDAGISGRRNLLAGELATIGRIVTAIRALSKEPTK